jgi:acyl dehydratase
VSSSRRLKIMTTHNEVQVKKHTTKITDEALAKLKGLVGKEIVGEGIAHPREDWEIEDSKFILADIRRLCRSIGDFNPLFTEMEYARNTRFGRPVVPPSIVLEEEQVDPEREPLVGCHAVLKAASVEWYIPILEGDALTGKSYVRDVQEVTGSPDAGRVVAQGIETLVSNHRGEKVATVKTSWNCCERGSAAELAIFDGRVPAMWNSDQIESVHQEYRGEEARGVIRGAEPRKWDEVEIGERIPYILKGPTTTTKRVSLIILSGFTFQETFDWYHGHGEAFEQVEKWPGLFFSNEFGAPEPVKGMEWSHVRAQQFLGVPGAMEASSERLHWTTQMLTNWQGDDGFLKRIDLKFPAINMMGDLTRCYGKVVGKRVDGDKKVIEIEVWNINQVGDAVTTGSAEVILP